MTLRTLHKDFTIITVAREVTVGGGWTLTLEILNLTGHGVVAPVSLGNDLVFTTEALAHRAGVLLGRHWLDGDGSTRGS